MSTVLVIPTDGNEQDKLLEVIQRWAKFFKGPLAKVILVGATDRLTGVLATTSAVTRIEVRQHQRRPRLNQQMALHEVLQAELAPGPTIIWSHDDIFLTKEVTLDELRYLTTCAIPEDPKPRKTRSPHHLALVETQFNLDRRGYPSHNYELHLPLVIDNIPQWRNLLPASDSLQFRTHVLNQMQEAPREFIADCKLFHEDDEMSPHGIFSTAKNLSYEAFV